MSAAGRVDPARIIAALNALGRGEMATVRARLDEARRACVELAQEELVTRLDEAASALARADLKTYRKRVESVISRLGHLK